MPALLHTSNPVHNSVDGIPHGGSSLEISHHRHARPRRPDGNASHGAKPYVNNPKFSEALDFAEAAVIYGREHIPADKACRSKDS